MIFTAISPLGHVVVYTEAAKAHIESGHPEMVGQDDAIRLTVEDPHLIYRSKDDPDNRHVYFRLGAHSEYPEFFLSVVVELTPPPAGVITAYPQPHVRGVQQEGGLIYVRPRR